MWEMRSLVKSRVSYVLCVMWEMRSLVKTCMHSAFINVSIYHMPYALCRPWMATATATAVVGHGSQPAMAHGPSTAASHHSHGPCSYLPPMATAAAVGGWWPQTATAVRGHGRQPPTATDGRQTTATRLVNEVMIGRTPWPCPCMPLAIIDHCIIVSLLLLTRLSLSE